MEGVCTLLNLQLLVAFTFAVLEMQFCFFQNPILLGIPSFDPMQYTLIHFCYILLSSVI